MMDVFLFTIWPIIGIVGVLSYWQVKELIFAHVDRRKSKHSFLVKLGIRVMMPGLGILMITQLLYGPFFSLPITSRFLFLLDGIGLCMVTCGVVLGVWARESMGTSWAHAADYQIVAEQRLVTSGPYAYVRHPIYTALLMMFTGTQMIVSNWLIGLRSCYMSLWCGKVRRKKHYGSHNSKKSLKHIRNARICFSPN